MNVEISDLTRRFGRMTAVAAVDLRAGPGVVGLLGPNGAGKTSLLRMMATVVGPTSGRLRLLERDPGQYGPRREIRRRLGYLPQHMGYYPAFTVAEFVEYFALLKEMPAAGVPAAVGIAVDRVDLGGQASCSTAPRVTSPPSARDTASAMRRWSAATARSLGSHGHDRR